MMKPRQMRTHEDFVGMYINAACSTRLSPGESMEERGTVELRFAKSDDFLPISMCLKKVYDSIGHIGAFQVAMFISKKQFSAQERINIADSLLHMAICAPRILSELSFQLKDLDIDRIGSIRAPLIFGTQTYGFIMLFGEERHSYIIAGDEKGLCEYLGSAASEKFCAKMHSLTRDVLRDINGKKLSMAGAYLVNALEKDPKSAMIELRRGY